MIRGLEKTDLNRIILANGIYHLARSVSFLWRRSDDWNDLANINQNLQRLKDEPNLFTPFFEDALVVLEEVLSENAQFTQDPNSALKSGRFDEEVDKKIYVRHALEGRKSKKKTSMKAPKQGS